MLRVYFFLFSIGKIFFFFLRNFPLEIWTLSFVLKYYNMSDLIGQEIGHPALDISNKVSG